MIEEREKKKEEREEMMRRIFAVLFFGVLILTACAPATMESTILPSPTRTPTIVPVTTTPSLTPSPSTETITPLPTIPTFTPTFDVQTIVTVTPAAKAVCPKENLALKPAFKFSDPSIKPEDEILKFLNDGGSIKTILSMLPSYYYPELVRSEDLTGDGIPELAYIYYSGDAMFFIYTCVQGKYTLYQSESSGWMVYFYGVYDMNLNGRPELVVSTRSCTGGGCYRYYVLEWNGTSYKNLAPEAIAEDVVDDKVTDINGDGTLELVIRTAPIPFYVNQPWQTELQVFSWDGNSLAAGPIRGYQPKYRFQVIQDSDLETTLGNYDTARNLYKQAIFRDSLEWWSKERQVYENAVVAAPWTHEPTPSVKPLEDKTEYPRLAAYAYYRILLLDLVQGQESDAENTYSTLQQKFGSDPYGHSYVKMATAFWNAYQSTHKMYDGCAAAIGYAAEHPDILTPLGSDYHGDQSHIYVPADVCPFR